MYKILISLIALILSASASFAAENKKVKRVENYLAVLDLEAVGKVEKDVVRPLTDSVRREIVKSGKYEVMDRGNMDKVLKEQAFQMTGCAKKECAVQAGEMLGVGKIVVGSVSKLGNTYLLSLQLVNIETGKVEGDENKECKCEVDDLIQLSRNVADELMVAAVAPANKETLMVAVAAPANVETSLTSVLSVQNNEHNCRKTDGRFCDQGDGTISDNNTGLMWQRSDDGQERKWNDAIDYCKGLPLAGKNDWRVPNKDELGSLVDKTKYAPASNTEYFPDTKIGGFFSRAEYWSSTVHASDMAYAWNVNFYFGELGYHDKMLTGYVRCVR